MLVKYSETEPQTDGSLACTCTRETFGCSIHPTTRDEWIASQRASLVRILVQQEKAQALQAAEAALSLKSSDQLMLFSHDTFSSKTARESGPKEGISLSGSWWRVDTPGATESLGRLMLALHISAIDGSALLPTLTVCGNYNRKGASATSGDGLITRLKMLLAQNLEPAARRGLKLNPVWAAWFMGWPMMWFRVR